MKKKQYKFSGHFLTKSKDPVKVVKEFAKVEKKYGKLTAETVLEQARNEKNILHDFFTWDNTAAAEKWRKEEARKLINSIEVRIISDGAPRQVPVFEIVTTPEGRQYKDIDVMTRDEVEEVRKEAVKQLYSVRNKINFFDSLRKADTFLQGAIDSLECETTATI